MITWTIYQNEYYGVHVSNGCSARIDMLLIYFLFISSNVFKYLIARRSNTALVILPLRVVWQAVPPDFLRVYAEFSDDALRVCPSASTMASSVRAIWSIHSTQISLIIIWNMFIIVQFGYVFSCRIKLILINITSYSITLHKFFNII